MFAHCFFIFFYYFYILHYGNMFFNLCFIFIEKDKDEFIIIHSL